MFPDGWTIRVATEYDLPGVIDTLREASEWEVARGLPHPWPVPFPLSRIRPALDHQDLYVVEDSRAQPAGTVTLVWADPAFWGERPADAGYIHRLAVRRAHAGRGIGRAILAWAEDVTRRKGRDFLRLDTLTASDGLHRFYRSAGFEAMGEVTVDGLPCTLFEKRLGPRRPR